MHTTGEGALYGSTGALFATGVIAENLGWEPVFWGVWITAFIVVEIPAVFNARKGDTFTESWRRWLHIKGGYDGVGQPVKPYPLWIGIPVQVAIVSFGVWLIGHLGFGWWG